MFSNSVLDNSFEEIKDAFNSSRWDYVSLITVGENKIVDKKLIVLFNDNNLLESWELVDQS